MAGKHAATPNKGKKVAVIVIIAVLAAALIGGGIFFFVSMNGKNDKGKKASVQVTTVETTAQTQARQQSQTKETGASAKASQGSAQDQTQAQQSAEDPGNQSTTAAADIVVPTQEGVKVSYFNATFIPNGEAQDAETGNPVSLREALGAGYSEGTITFNDDGTFTDSLTAAGEMTGKYVVQDEKITATYSDDRNMEIKVTSWNDGTPAQFSVNYGGCIVFFG